MRGAALAVLLLLGGCLGAVPEDEAEPAAPAPQAVPPPHGPAADPPSPPPATPTIAVHGLHFSACSFRDSAFFFKHEWAEGVVPPDYRPLNYQAGDIGSLGIQVRSCAGLAIGNGTFTEDGAIGIFAVPVEPPAEVDGPAADAYLLAFMLDDPGLVAQFASSAMPAALAEFALGEQAYRLDAGHAFAAEVTELVQQEQEDAYTSTLRLHWMRPEGRCWSDVDHHVTTTLLTEARLEARAGSILQLAGPADTLAGLGTHGTTDGSIGPPACIGR